LLRNFIVFISLSGLLIFSGVIFAQDGEEAGTGEEEAPVILDEIAGERNLTGSRPWRAPNYAKQEQALGWTPTTFSVPTELTINYQFWLDVYTKYTTDQGILHDSEYIDLVYEILDFTHISSRTDLKDNEKSRMKTKAVKEAKKRVVAMLKKLHGTKDPSTLTADEKKIWEYLAKVDDKRKFLDATKKNRVRFQLGQRDRIVQGIFFSGRYLESFEQTFRDAGLPIELTRLPFVESSFNVLARSKVGASGLWQIMRYTGRPFMTINATIDKRNFPTDATKLAAKLLKINYNMLQDWPLAITGYNHGPAGVLRLTKSYKSREIGQLIQNIGSKRRLGFASRNFYASFLAVLEAERNAPKYFGNVYWSKPLNSMEIQLSQPVKWKDILSWFDNKDQIAQIYNPHITALARKFGRPVPVKAVISVPADKKDLVLAKLEELKKSPAMARLEKSMSNAELKTYKVMGGDTLTSIARDYGVSLRELIVTNHMDPTETLRIGQEIMIP
jgi:membrane-bound lytic murein transglycosylase D